MTKFIKFLGVLAIVFASLIYKIYVLTKIWGYIGVKLFGLPPVGMWKSFALISLINFMVDHEVSDENKIFNAEKAARKTLIRMVAISFSWFFCYLFFG